MKKNNFIFAVFIICIMFSQIISMPSFAFKQVSLLHKNKIYPDSINIDAFKENPEEKNIIYTHLIKNEQLEAANHLNVFLAGYLFDINAHNLKKIEDYYASNYISGDGFNKKQLIESIKQTWEKFPDLKYSISIKNLRFDNNRASIEFTSNITATTKDKSDITKDSGFLSGTSNNIIYLEKYGCGWKIITDKTLYEENVIKYGTAKKINFDFNVPEQVLSGEDYTASLKVDLPSNFFALGSLASAPIAYPLKQPEEVFRQISPELLTIERVIKSNTNNLNEISSASVCFCEAERTNYSDIEIKVTGTAVIFKRINVLPKH